MIEEKDNAEDMNLPEEGELLLPWKVIDRLDPSERESVDAYLRANQEAKLHLRLIEEERTAAVEENEILSGAPAGALARIHQRIEEEDGPAIQAAKKPALMTGLKDFLSSFEGRSLHYAAAAAAIIILVQAVAIGTLMTSHGRVGPFETASYPEANHAAQGTHLIIAFEDQVTAGEIIKLFQEVGGQIVGGPTPDGMYTVKISEKTIPKRQLDALIKNLEARTGVIEFVGEAG